MKKYIYKRESDNSKNNIQVLSDEGQAVHGTAYDNYLLVFSASKVKSQAEHQRRCLELDQAALCLSGGGIRSAAFALGVIQALARRGLLTRFHYLSTVSGGGYIGGWLVNWIKNKKFDLAEVNDALASRDGEADQVRWLRQYSNFLTPRVGLASIDMWSSIVIWVRNVLLNWSIFLPALLMLTCAGLVYLDAFGIEQIAGARIQFDPTWPGRPYFGLVEALGWGELGRLVLAALCLMAAIVAVWQFLPSHDRTAIGSPPERPTPGRIYGYVIAPAIAWSVLAPWSIGTNGSEATDLACIVASFGLAAMLLGYPAGYLVWCHTDRGRARPGFHFWKNYLVWGICSLWTSLVVWFVIWSTVTYGPRLGQNLVIFEPNLLLAIVAPVGMALSHLGLMATYVAYRRSVDRKVDQDLEWLGRLSATELLWVCIGAILLGAIGILSPLLFKGLLHPTGWTAGLTTFISAAVAVFGGWSGITAFLINGAGAKGVKAWRQAIGLIVGLAAIVFILVLFAGAANVIGWLLDEFRDYRYWSSLQYAAGHTSLALVFLVVAGLTSWQLKVNRFSLHGMYRNRLVRCFLGAATTARREDPFSGFDENDNPKLCSLLASKAGRPSRLFPVINATLNLNRTSRLQWQERKAASFTFTPLACGSAALGGPAGAFVVTREYGGSEPDDQGNKGVSLGTAMTISGAAVSPNMGYHSSPAVALLMSAFNLRLGAWLPNPDPAINETWDRSQPSSPLALIKEMLGATSECSKDIYLSDGGHFENLGLYEMVRRGCRFILVVDAAADKDAQFEDLANAVRKISIDLNVTIDLEVATTIPDGRKADPIAAFAWGTITYPPDAQPCGKPASLLYLKPRRLDGLPPDILGYSLANPDFPHETTADQFFSESQFEAYRHMGEWLVNRFAQGRSESIEQFMCRPDPATVQRPN